MSQSKVRLGVIGSSDWTEFAYLKPLRDFHAGEVVAIAGRNADRLTALAQRHEIPTVYTDWREMVDSGSIDAVVVATPDSQHAMMASYAAMKGLAVMCEKPLASNADEAREMVRFVEMLQRPNNVMFTYRHNPAMAYVKDLLASGVLGQIFHSEFRYLMGYARDTTYRWRLDGEEGTGALGDLGVHVIDLAQWLVAPVASVSASLHTAYVRVSPAGNPVAPANDSAALVVDYMDGSIGSIFATLVADLGDREMEQTIKIHGEKGTLEFTLVYAGSLQGAHLYLSLSGSEQAGRLEIPEQYRGGRDANDMWGHLETEDVGVRQFVMNVANCTQIGPNFADGYLAQLVVDAAFVSAAEGRRVDIAEIDACD